MKKLSIGLAILFTSVNSSAFAGNNSSPFCVTVPNFACGGIEFGLTGLYWRPSAPYLDYALGLPTTTLLTNPFAGGRYHSNDFDYDWGFKINLGYRIPCSGNDIMLTYTHYDQEDTRTHIPTDELFVPAIGAPPLPPLVGPVILEDILLTPGADLFFTIPLLPTIIAPAVPVLPIITNYSAKAEFEHHALDLDFGQYINMGCNFRLHWFGGLRYANLENKFDQTYDAVADVVLPTVTTPITVAITVAEEGIVGLLLIDVSADVLSTSQQVVNQKTKFNGIGPRFGMEANYMIGGGIGISVGASTSLLVGEAESAFSARLDSTTTFTPIIDFTPTADIEPFITGLVTFTPPTPDVVVETSYKHPDETRVVPNFDGKIALNYAYQFCNASRSTLSIEAGYLVSHYWNTIDRLSIIGSISPAFRTRHTTDVSFDGPYVGIQVQL